MRIYSSNLPACSRWFSRHLCSCARLFRGLTVKNPKRKFSLWRQMLVICTLLAFVAGTIGLPVAHYQTGDSGTGSCASGTCSAGGVGGCRCSETARNSGTCCCARKKQEDQPEIRSCCARTEMIVCQTSEIASCCETAETQIVEQCDLNSGCCSSESEPSESPIPRWTACGCGCQSKTLFLTCDDPRLSLELALLHFWSPESGLLQEHSGFKPFFLQCPEPPPPRLS